VAFSGAGRLKVGAEFCGWPIIQKLHDVARQSRDKRLLLTMFKTGGRVSEVLSLTSADIDHSLSEISAVVRMKVLKKQAGLMRSIPILRAEPLTSEWLDSLHGVEGLLFTGWSRKKPIDRRTAYHIVRKIGDEAGIRVSDHWFRGMRASELVDDYQFEPYDLRQYFKWTRKKEDMAERYASMSWRGLERRMLESMPSEWKAKLASGPPDV
jgi:integrase